MKYFYLRDENRTPVACVASRLHTPDEGGIEVEFAASTWNPKDKFSKKIARDEARKKLDTIYCWGIPFAGRDIKKRICETLAGDELLPAKTRNAAQLWLENHNRPRMVFMDEAMDFSFAEYLAKYGLYI